MDRTLEKDGVNFAFPVLPELKDRMKGVSRRFAKRHGAKGAELRSQAYAMGSLICYFLGLPRLERDRILDVGRTLLHARFQVEEDSPFEPSVPAGDVDPGTVPLVEIGVSLGSHVHNVDPKGQDEPAKRRRTPKRGL